MTEGGIQQLRRASESLDRSVLHWGVFQPSVCLSDLDWEVWGAGTLHRKPVTKEGRRSAS